MSDNVIAALSEEHVASVTGLTIGQLRAWDRKGFFVPKHAYDDRRAAYSRIYSFKDVVGLKTVATLRSKYKIGFEKLRDVAAKLREKGFEHWADTTLYVVKKEVNFRDPSSGSVESLRDGQLAMLEIIDVINDVKSKVEDLRNRREETIGNVERHKFVARNSWVVSGTRIPTATIKRYHDAGFSISQILDEYPSLTVQDIAAAITHEENIEKSA